MNVLVLSKYDLELGGVAMVLQALCAYLPKLGAQPTLLSSDPSARKGRLPDGFPCTWGRLPKPGLWGSSIRYLVEICRRDKIDLVHAHGAYRAGYAALKLKRKLGLPYVVTSHGDLLPEPLYGRRIGRPRPRRRFAEILRAADAVTHLNAFMQESACRVCDVTDKSHIVPVGTDLRWWEEPAPPAAGNYILAIGRLVRAKGFAVLLGAYQRLAARMPGVALVIAGDGPYRPDLLQEARRLGLPLVNDPRDVGPGGTGVCFPGLTFGQRKRELFLGCRLVAFPSQSFMSESFGIVQLEAMAAGKALVCSDIPAVHSMVTHGRNGLIVPPADEAAWAEALERLLRDDALRGEMGAHNRQEVRRYDWPVVVAQFKEVYDCVLSKRQA